VEYQPIDREGNFRGRIMEFKAVEGKHGSVSVLIKVFVTGWWNVDSQEWDDTWDQYGMMAEGAICLVKNDKQLNDSGVRQLVECANWDGIMASITAGQWNPSPIAFSVKEDTYNKETRLRINFINPFDSTPGAGGMSEDAARLFDNKYGSPIRVLMGNVVRNAAPVPDAKPLAPPARPAAPKAKRSAPKPGPEAEADTIANDEVDENAVPF
jgi:hypothetical protein